MCGFVGAVFQRSAQRFNTARALATIAYRGPDESHTEHVGDASFAFARLKVLDLSVGGRQPMLTEDRRYALMFNGEIYNHHELRRELRALGHTFVSASDTEVLLRGAREWGAGVVQKLDGMFALAIWDAHERTLLIARDRVGKKPIHYACEADRFSFASEAKALLAAGVSDEIDVQALVPLLEVGRPRAPQTMYSSVRELPPAHTMLVRAVGTGYVCDAPVRYWRPPFHEPVFVSDEDAIRGVRDRLIHAVERRLEADVPVGAFLSGGVDSSIIVGIATRLLGKRLPTFAVGFTGDARFDETAHAREVAELFGSEHSELFLGPQSFELIERLVELHDGPFGDSSAIPTSLVCELARQSATVVLTGEGGDELFCGYPRYLAVEAAEQVPASGRRLLARVAGSLGTNGPSRKAAFARALVRSALPFADRLSAWTRYVHTDLRLVLQPHVAAELDLDATRRELRALADETKGASALARTLDFGFRQYLPDDLLVKTDRCSMMHSLELRCPFLDTSLVEYAARLPNRHKRQGSVRKWILRKAFADLVPSKVFTRKKMGFGMPLSTWFRSSLRDYLFDHLTGDRELFRYVRRDYVDDVLNAHMSGVREEPWAIWILLTLQIWLAKRARARTSVPPP